MLTVFIGSGFGSDDGAGLVAGRIAASIIMHCDLTDKMTRVGNGRQSRGACMALAFTASMEPPILD